MSEASNSTIKQQALGAIKKTSKVNFTRFFMRIFQHLGKKKSFFLGNYLKIGNFGIVID